MTPAPTQIVTHAPTWVWGLLLALLLLGLSQARDRLVGRRAAMILPIVMLLVSLNALRTAFGLGTLPFGAWALGVAGTATAIVLAGWPRGITWRAGANRLAVPGSWVPLMMFLAIFALKFAVGAATAIGAPVTGHPAFVPVVASAYGAFSGVFLGRAAAMWQAMPTRLRCSEAPSHS
ncbi:DUF6622 family protein [Rhizobacter sp. Root1221]|uniref:DUF6622 family protein n=1 Tax=Rhizobacter sp. Root1221 TaxID=1736433 RepID=UPI0006F1FC39|nr:DUF6622 family protein [Rhizobacter sp. Root1221]KQW02258.1 hypothetical protein ASC87_13605 [Rhizobacter sp. Root1221]